MTSSGDSLIPIKGGCHCGAIRWLLESPLPPDALPVRACQCSFCLKHGGRYTSDPDARLTLEVSARDLVSRYRFGHGTADFILCRRCGTLIAATMEGSGPGRAVLNVNTADQPGAFTNTPRQSDFDAESREERLARRHENWIGQVTWIDSPPG